MSSPSDTDSEVAELPRRTESLPHNGQNGQEDVWMRRHVPIVTMPSSATTDPFWLSREPLSHSAAGPSLSSFTRATFQAQAVPIHYMMNPPLTVMNMPVEARRQNIMAMDRKRRLTGSTHDNGGRHRRSIPSGFNDRDDMPYGHTSDPFASGSQSSGTYQRHRFGASSSTEVIDLTSSSPQATRAPPSFTRIPSMTRPGPYAVPRWQADSEVSECPICQRPFNFLFRRHHCRKCGRVVCNDCSPHRITIPRHFIVNPPGPAVQTSAGGSDAVVFTEDDENYDDADNHNQRSPITLASSRQYRQTQNNAIRGGEKVRLCNPCVPDPQPDPQPEPQLNYARNTLSPSSRTGRRDDLLTLSDALRTSRHEPHNNNNSLEPFPGFVPQHTFSFTIQPPQARPLPRPPQYRHETEHGPPQPNSLSYPSSDRYRQRGHMSFDNPQTMLYRPLPSDTSRVHHQLPANRPRMRPTLEESYLPRTVSGWTAPARPRLNEEDACPVCRRSLPPKGPGGDESAREAHIIECISARDPSNQTSVGRGTGGPRSLPRGPMHMLPFVATEKDCVSDDGNTPECSICMVEYNVGDELARLECLCKFHRECIGEWFTRKQECPVHKTS